jgi:GrpB-like predicted nucleotidyltransferase (UPF0157 family)
MIRTSVVLNKSILRLKSDNLFDLDQRIKLAAAESVEIVRYDPLWPDLFTAEARFLRSTLPDGLITRIEHFGSTAVPGLAAKPIIDMLIEVSSLPEAVVWIVPVLTGLGYDYFWRPPFGDSAPPEEWYAWFIKRNAEGRRTHHLHCVEASSKLWERLRFRDYLRTHPDLAQEYSELKMHLAASFPNDREAYTRGKDQFIERVMKEIQKRNKRMKRS